MTTIDEKITQLQEIATILGDGSVDDKIAQLQREKYIMEYRANLAAQQAANMDKKNEMIALLGEDSRAFLEKTIVCDDKACSGCVCCKFESLKAKLTPEQIKLVLF